MANIYTRLLLNTDGFDKNLFKAQKSLKTFSATSQGIFSGLSTFSGYAAAFLGVSTSIHAAVTTNMEFEKSLSSLRSLTGVSVDELNYFRTEAIRMGMDSTQSAKQMVDAFKLIGSQMPELLKNKEALTQTAEAAVTLAEAAELDVPTAAKALTGALNQMGESSAHAAEYINILAAASQKGSADIPYLNKAIENAGGAASSVGIKFNELVAAVEAIAPKITDAASNGTNLRNIFLTLESATDSKLRPSVVGLSKALENLAAKNLDAVQLTKIFGKESVTAAIALLKERDAFEDLRTGIVGTNTAYEQAQINTDNLAGSVGKLQSAWTSFINTMAGSNGFMSDIVSSLKDAVEQATLLMMSEQERTKYNNDKRFKKGIEINQQDALTRLNERIGKGSTVEEAVAKGIEEANRMYPEALKYSVRLEALERARAEAEKARRKEMKYGASVAYDDVKQTREKLANAEALFKISEEEYVMRNAIYDVLKQQGQQLKKNEEETNTTKVVTEEVKFSKGSLGYLDEQIREQQKKFAQATTNEARVAVQKTIKELEAQKIFLKAQVETTIFQAGKTAPGKATENKVDFSSLAGGIEIPKIQLPDMKSAIDDNEEYADSFLMISQSIGTMTNAFASSSDSIGQWALQSISSIAQMVLQLQSLATAQGVASAAKLPFPANLGAIATVVATIASIFSSLPKYADGGIVGGSSFYGDKLLARVNSGEMILNKNQQKSLYSMTGGTEITLGVSRIQGADLFLALKNYMSKTGKRL